MVVRASVVPHGDVRRECHPHTNACIIQFLILNQYASAVHKYHLTRRIRNSPGLDILPVVNRFSVHRVRFVDLVHVIAR